MPGSSELKLPWLQEIEPDAERERGWPRLAFPAIKLLLGAAAFLAAALIYLVMREPAQDSPAIVASNEDPGLIATENAAAGSEASAAASRLTSQGPVEAASGVRIVTRGPQDSGSGLAAPAISVERAESTGDAKPASDAGSSKLIKL